MIKKLFRLFLGFEFFFLTEQALFCLFFSSKRGHSKSYVVKALFLSSLNLNKAEQILKLHFYLRLQNTENFALCASSALIEQRYANWLADIFCLN